MTVTTTAPRTTAAVPAGGPLARTGELVRTALRRDRIWLPVWVLAIGLTVVATAGSFPGLYPDAAARQLRATLMESPAAVAMGGPKIGMADYTFGAMMTNEMLGWTALVVALMSILTVVRHTRTDEESGRTELVLAAPVGRYAPLATALIIAMIANLAIAVISAVGMASLGLDSIGWAGSWLFAMAVAAVGIVFAGVAAVTAQITEHGRAASGLAGIALGVAHTLRAVGDVAEIDALSWLSPIGWAQRTYAYVDDRWWPLLPAVVLSVGLVGLAAWLSGRRDLGAGLRQPRPGPAGSSISTPFGLALRLQRGALVAWVLSVAAFSLLYGTLIGEVEGFAAELSAVSDVIGGMGGDNLIDGFLAMLTVLLAMTASIFVVIAVLRARHEERAGTGEQVLSTPASRASWLSAHAAVAALGGAAILVTSSVAVGISGGFASGQPDLVARVLPGALVQIVPLLAIVGLTAALYGLVPRVAGLAWIVVGYGMFVGTLGGLLGLPQWAMDLSPFGMLPVPPAESFEPLPTFAMLAVSLMLFAVGLWGLRRRDFQAES